MLDNAAIAELLVREAETATDHREQAFRRAAHEAFMWPEEAADFAAANRSLTDLAGIGPWLAKRLQGWLEVPPVVEPPPVRREFMTLAHARRVLAKSPKWRSWLNGDLQVHTEWSDGGGTISEMAAAAIEQGYKFIAITDHTKGLKIAGGLDEVRLEQQGCEIAALNKQLRTQRIEFTILRSAEMNLSPTGEGDMQQSALRKLDLVLGCFHSDLRRTEDQTGRYIAGLRVRAVADGLHLRLPIAVRDMVDLLEPIRLSFELNAGTCSGSCEITTRSDGFVHYTGKVHNSGALAAAYTAITSLPVSVASGGPVIIAHRGHVGGTLSLDTRDDSWDQTANDAVIADNWAVVKGAAAFARTDFGTGTGAFELADAILAGLAAYLSLISHNQLDFPDG